MEQQQEIGQGAYTLDDYQGWWARSIELHEYLKGMPPRMAASVGMDGQRSKLLEGWLDLQRPESFDEFNEDAATDLLAWIQDTETLIHFVVYRPKAAADRAEATKPKLKKLELIETLAEVPGMETQWHWPWIDGWDSPAKREKILNPPKDRSMIKKVLLVGAGVGAAIYVGKRIMSE